MNSDYVSSVVILSVLCFFLMIRRTPRSTRIDTLFPTRRSSDLFAALVVEGAVIPGPDMFEHVGTGDYRSEEHTSELQSLMRTSYAVFCLKKNNLILPY